LQLCEGGSVDVQERHVTHERAHARARILVVDDEPFDVDVLEQELEQLDYGTLSAENGEEALDALAREQVDLILLDVMMPRLDGYGVLAQIRNHEV
jgi:adenylate cyclase